MTEDETTNVVRYELGSVNSVTIELYDSVDFSFLEYRLLSSYELSSLNPAIVFEARNLGAVGISETLRSDSIVITINGDRRITSQAFRDPSPLFLTEFYQNPGGDIYIKTFTQEDYENADPF
ncbi:MAG: hypothetical protein WBA16_05975 [Nonlabens sp.]